MEDQKRDTRGWWIYFDTSFVVDRKLQYDTHREVSPNSLLWVIGFGWGRRYTFFPQQHWHTCLSHFQTVLKTALELLRDIISNNKGHVDMSVCNKALFHSGKQQIMLKNVQGCDTKLLPCLTLWQLNKGKESVSGQVLFSPDWGTRSMTGNFDLKIRCDKSDKRLGRWKRPSHSRTMTGSADLWTERMCL